ncbi:MAG: hypothetical protein INF65_17360 [Roseomonas sp.]|nr:hypothetical protein [Roseomonas sp.]MCA3390395.1 hypothetical protein [Roseomonas sp.]MCA3391455.1 hypothetical protein [Roseomonas sp.]
MLTTSYVYEKLSTAVQSLATNTENLQTRLEFAYTGALIRLTEDDFAKADQKKLFGEIKEVITAIDGNSELGSVRATLNKMSDDAARELAKKVFELYTSILR